MRSQTREGRVALGVLLALAAACDQPTSPSGIQVLTAPPGPSLAISDAANSGRAHFYFLPPLAPDASPFGGTFDATLQPTAKICRLNAAGTACATDVVSFPFGGGGSGITVNKAGQSYNANWNSPSNLTTSPTAKYRLEVYVAVPGVGSTTLGFADIWVVDKSKDLKGVPSGYDGLVRGSPLQIKFRIENGAVGAVSVSPASASITAPATQAFTATVRDLVGVVMASPPTINWSSSNTAAATVSPSTGSSTLATPVGGGTTTITATSGGVSGQATLIVASEAAPAVTSTTPAPNASNVATGSNVSITFTEPVNVAGDWFQIACGTSGTRKPSVAGSVTVSDGPTTFTLDPSADFAPGESCTVTVYAAQVTDQDSNDPPDNMAADYVFSFSTADNAPFVNSTTPVQGTTGVAKNTNITVNFSESVNFSAASFTIACPVGTPQTFALVGSSPALSVTLDPAADLPGNTTCTVTAVAAQVTDQDANDPPDGMAADFTFTFTTQANDAAPSAVADPSYATGVGVTVNVAAPGVLANDNLGSPAAALTSFGGGSLGGTVTDHAAASTATFGTGGSLKVNADGSFDFTPAAGFSGAFTFQYRLTNGAGSSDATVTILVTQMPSAVNDAYSTPNNTTLAGVSVITNDGLGSPAATVTSIGGGSLGGSVTSNATPASVSLAGGTLAVGADGGLSLTSPTTAGVYTFQYRLTNSQGTSDGTVTITVTRPPDAKDDAVQTTKSTTLNGDVTANNGSGADDLGVPAATVVSYGGGSLGGTVTSHAAGTPTTLAGGTLTVNADGTFSLTNPTTSGVFTFTYRLTNSAGSDDATVTVSVNGSPTAADDAPAQNSAPGSALHGFINQTFTLAAPGLLANDDLGMPLGTITKFGKIQAVGSVDDNNAGSSASFLSGGSLTVNPDGSVSLTPPNNFTGYVIFEYRVANSAGSDVGQATIAIGRRPAPVNDTYSTSLIGNVGINTAKVNGTGFTVLANDVGDNVTLMVSGPPANGSVTLNTNGTFGFNPAAGFSNGNASFSYTLTNGFGTSAAATVTIPVSNTLVWFVDNAAASNGDGRLGTPFNTLTPLNGAGGSGDSDAAGHNIFLYTGNATYSGGLVLENNERLIGQGATASLATIASLSVPTDVENFPATGGTPPTLVNAGGNGVTLASGNTLRGFNLGNASGSAISGSSFGTASITDLGINTTGQALSLTTGTLAATLSGVTSSGGANNVLLSGVTASGTIALGAGTLLNATGAAFSVVNGTGAASYTGTITGTVSGPAVSVNGGSMALTFTGDVTQSAANRLVDIQNTSGGSVTFNTGTVTGGASATGVNIGSANGDVTFTNGLTLGTPGSRMTNQAVTITNGASGVTYRLGAISVFTSNAAGLVATNFDGTLNFTGTVDATAAAAGTNAPAISIDGPAGLTTLGVSLTRVSANNALTGVLVKDANGSFTVTGTGTTDGSGGVISNITNRGAHFENASGITLSNMTFTNVGTVNGADPTSASSACGDINQVGTNTSCNAGIHAVGVNGLALTNVDLNGGAQQGINGDNVTNFTLSNSSVLNFGDQVRESGVKMNNLFGTSAITNSTISGNEERQVEVQNDQGTLTNFTIASSTLSTSAAPNGAQGLLFSGSGAGSMKLTVTSSTFQNLRSTGIQTDVQGGNPSMEITITGSTFQNDLAAAIDIIQAFSGNVKFNVSNNPTLVGLGSHVININQQTTSTLGSLLQGKIEGNTIGNTGSGTSGTTAGSGVRIRSLGQGTTIANVINNTIRGVTERGVFAELAEGTSANNTLHTTITGNFVNLTDPNADRGILVHAGIAGTADDGVACADISGNNAASAGVTGDGIRVRQREKAELQMPGYAGALTDAAAVVSYLQARNPATTDTFSASAVPVGDATAGFKNTPGGAACVQPSLPSP